MSRKSDLKEMAKILFKPRDKVQAFQIWIDLSVKYLKDEYSLRELENGLRYARQNQLRGIDSKWKEMYEEYIVITTLKGLRQHYEDE